MGSQWQPLYDILKGPTTLSLTAVAAPIILRIHPHPDGLFFFRLLILREAKEGD